MRDSVKAFILHHKIIFYWYIILLHISTLKGHHQARIRKIQWWKFKILSYFCERDFFRV